MGRNLKTLWTAGILSFMMVSPFVLPQALAKAEEAKTKAAVYDIYVKHLSVESDGFTKEELKTGKYLEDMVRGEEYSLSPEEFDGYLVYDVPDRSYGLMPGKDLHLTYKYIHKNDTVGREGTLTVKYLNEFGSEILPRDILTGFYGKTVSVGTKYIPGYELIDVSGMVNVPMTYKPQTLTFVYKKTEDIQETPSVYVYEYVDEDGALLAKPQTVRLFGGASVMDLAKKIPGYTLVESPVTENQMVPDKKTEQTLTYVYKADELKIAPTFGTVTVRHILDGKTVIPDEIYTGEIGSPYETYALSLTDMYVQSVDYGFGTFSEENQTITYVYGVMEKDKTYGTLQLRYQTEDGRQILSPSYRGSAVGDPYSVDALTFDDYTLKHTLGQKEGKFMAAPGTVTFVYERTVTEDSVEDIPLDETDDVAESNTPEESPSVEYPMEVAPPPEGVLIPADRPVVEAPVYDTDPTNDVVYGEEGPEDVLLNSVTIMFPDETGKAVTKIVSKEEFETLDLSVKETEPTLELPMVPEPEPEREPVEEALVEETEKEPEKETVKESPVEEPEKEAPVESPITTSETNLPEVVETEPEDVKTPQVVDKEPETVLIPETIIESVPEDVPLETVVKEESEPKADTPTVPIVDIQEVAGLGYLPEVGSAGFGFLSFMGLGLFTGSFGYLIKHRKE